MTREFVITFYGQWNWRTQKSPVLAGVVQLANAMRGTSNYLAIIGGMPMEMVDSGSAGAWYEPLSGVIKYNRTSFTNPNWDPMVATVHELAHAWDSLPFAFSWALNGELAPTWYATQGFQEWWAETVTVAVLGKRYTDNIRGSQDADYDHKLSQKYVDYLGWALIVDQDVIRH